jgi:hypothetical protein
VPFLNRENVRRVLAFFDDDRTLSTSRRAELPGSRQRVTVAVRGIATWPCCRGRGRKLRSSLDVANLSNKVGQLLLDLEVLLLHLLELLLPLVTLRLESLDFALVVTRLYVSLS